MKFPIFSRKEVAATVPTSTDKKDIAVALTPVGKQKAEQFSLEGPKFDVLATLLEDGTMSMSEIGSKTGYSVNKVKEICRSLERNRYVKLLRI